MSDNQEDHKFFQLRKEGKTYISKVFQFNERDTERVRLANIVFEGTETVLLGEIEGALCLRMTGEKRKTQVIALVSQDDAGIRRITLQTSKNRAGDWYEGFEKESFTFRAGEFERLLEFLNQIKFIDLSNEDKSQIEDISSPAGPKAIIDASGEALLSRIRNLDNPQRETLFRSLHDSLSVQEINLLLGRKQALSEFEAQINMQAWNEKDWQGFFDRERWVFGYGLDYRIIRPFDREMTVGEAGTDNQNKSIVDFLMSFTNYTVLVEIKRPDTPIFQSTRSGRSGTWRFSSDFIDAVSQILEQKSKWLSFGQKKGLYDKAGSKRLEAHTRNAKTILVIGNSAEFDNSNTLRDEGIKRDTFELFRRDMQNIDIVTYDELFERVRFITKD